MDDALAVLEGRARWTVITGDSASILPALPATCVDHVITDPPYEVEAHTKQRTKLGNENESLAFEPMTQEMRSLFGLQIARLTRRWALVFCQVEAAMLWREVLSSMSYRRTAIWVKPDPTPQFSGDRPAMGYESIVCCHARGKSRWNGGGRAGVFIHSKHAAECREHETQKPVSLMLELISLFTDPDEVVLDPFAGAGTTGVAAVQQGRRCILIEKEPRWANIARERCIATENNMTLAALRAGQLPLFPGRG